MSDSVAFPRAEDSIGIGRRLRLVVPGGIVREYLEGLAEGARHLRIDHVL